MTNHVLNRHINKDTRRRCGHRIVGMTLVISGFARIAKHAGWIPGTLSLSAIFWPLALCFLGAFMIAGIKNRK